MQIILILGPLVIITALGYILKRSGFASEGFFRETNRLVFWVALPCLLFVSTARGLDTMGPAMRVFGVLAGGMGGCILLAYLLAFIFKLRRPSIGAFVQGAFRGNLVYVGWPIVLNTLAVLQDAPVSESLRAFSFMAIAPLIPMYNAGAVFVLLAGQPAGGGSIKGQVKMIARKTITNPLLIGVVAGLIYSLFGTPLPQLLDKTLSEIGQMTLPLALLGIGASLTFKGIKKQLLFSIMGASLKIIAAPIIGYILGRMVGFNDQELLIAMIYLGCPTAIASYLMADQMDCDAELASGIVIMTMLLAPISLGIIILMNT